MEQDLHDEFFDQERIEIFIFLEDPALYSSNSVLISVIRKCFGQITGVERKKQIETLLTKFNWVVHYSDKNTGRRVLSQTTQIEHNHELVTAIRLTEIGFDVIFAPGAMFSRDTKRFDVILIRDSVILDADLKYITSKLPETIAQRIRGGSEQASRVVLHINSDIKKKVLLEGLKRGVERNRLIKEIFLFYRGKMFRLKKSRVLNGNCFE